jgi:hypothetical protein
MTTSGPTLNLSKGTFNSLFNVTQTYGFRRAKNNNSPPKKSMPNSTTKSSILSPPSSALSPGVQSLSRTTKNFSGKSTEMIPLTMLSSPGNFLTSSFLTNLTQWSPKFVNKQKMDSETPLLPSSTHFIHFSMH